MLKKFIKNKRVLISVIVLNYNGKKYLAKCLSSLQKNDYDNYEVILVDNASTDGSVEFVQKKFFKVKIIQNKIGLGFAGGNNVGIKNAKGNFILLISNDTWVENNFIKKIANFYFKNNFDVISPREATYNGNSKSNSYATLIDPLGHHVFLTGKEIKNKKSFYLTGVCLFFSKKMYLETGGMDEKFFLYWEDVDWFWRLHLLRKKFSYINNIFVYHVGAGSSEGMVNTIKYSMFYYRNRNTLQMLLKNYSYISLILILPLYIIQNIIEIIFFLIILKPKVAFSYIEGWIFNIINIKNIVKKRNWIQKNRIKKDLFIFKKMYWGLGKFRHLLVFLKNRF